MYTSRSHSHAYPFLKVLFVFAVTAALSCFFAPGGQAAPFQGSGQILNEIPPPPALSPAPAPNLTITPHKAGAAQPGISFQVDHIRITGNKLFSTRRLHALVASAEGKKLNLVQLDALALRITRFYQGHGYPLDRAYIPPQTIKNGTLRIAVVEARYDRVSLNNNSRVCGPLLDATLSPVSSGEQVSLAPLNRSLLLLNQIPGVIARSSLSPGEKTGTSDLTVEADPLPRFAGSVGIDDYGDRYTGRARLNANLAINNPLCAGDQFTIGALTTGDRLNYETLGYTDVINGWGTVVGASGSFMHYRLGDTLKDLDAHGDATTGTALIRQPLIRSLRGDLDIQLAYNYIQLDDDVNATRIYDDRHISSLDLALTGDYRDRWGTDTASATLTAGRVTFDNGAAQQTDEIGPDTEGDFARLYLALARLQPLTEKDSLYVSANGQLAGENLDPSEKIYLGGPWNVSGYDPSTVGGDEGGVVSAELRHNFTFPIPGLWQAVAFVNDGYIQVNKFDEYTKGSKNSANLCSAGVGFNWQGPRELSASFRVATPFGAEPTLLAGDSRATRFWAQVQKVF